MNVRLLRRVKKHILAEPKRFLMGDFVVKKSEHHKTFQGDDGSEHEFAQCGTAACIAGWAMLLDKPSARYGRMGAMTLEKRAAKLLGLDVKEKDSEWNTQSERLFFECNWPSKFSDRYNRAGTQEERVRIAAERIEHFISTKGAE